MTKRTLLATVVFGALTGLAAAVAIAATRRSVDSIWYWRLKKPKFQPPREAFAPVSLREQSGRSTCCNRSL